MKSLCRSLWAARAVADVRGSIDDRDMSAACVSWLAAVTVAAGSGSGYGAQVLLRRSGSAGARRRPAVLIALGLLAVGAVGWRFAERLSLYPAYLLLAVIAVPLAAFDTAERRIPDAIVMPAFLLAAALLAVDAVRAHQSGALLRAFLAAAAVYAAALVLILSAEESMGWGDGKLSALLAFLLGYLGWGRVLEGLLLAFVAAALVAGGLVLSGHRGARLPLAPFLLCGTLVAVLAAGL
jgi:leader peptidase (prepilin peptidase) / N-methyltransferase